MDRTDPKWKSPLFLAADGCELELLESMADWVVRRYGYLSHWVLRMPWRDDVGEAWSALLVEELP